MISLQAGTTVVTIDQNCGGPKQVFKKWIRISGLIEDENAVTVLIAFMNCAKCAQATVLIISL